MSFKPYKKEGGLTPWEEQPCSAITPKIGLALYMSSGKLAICPATTKPAYISMEERDEAVTAGELINVIPVDDETLYETQASVSISSIVPGDKVTIASDGLRVTATKTSGVAEVVDYDGTAAGAYVYVRFR